jgi:uncharacterized protein YozE (UPF0346 family)
MTITFYQDDSKGQSFVNPAAEICIPGKQPKSLHEVYHLSNLYFEDPLDNYQMQEGYPVQEEVVQFHEPIPHPLSKFGQPWETYHRERHKTMAAQSR